MSQSLPELDAQLYRINQELAALDKQRTTLLNEQNRLRRLRSEAIVAQGNAPGSLRCTKCAKSFGNIESLQAHTEAKHANTAGREAKVAEPKGQPQPQTTVPGGSKASDIPMLMRWLHGREVTHRSLGKGRISLIEHRGPNLYLHVLFGVSRRSSYFDLSSLVDRTFFEQPDEETRSVASRLLTLVEGKVTQLTHDELLRFKDRELRLDGQRLGRVVVVNERFITLKLCDRDEYRSFWTPDFFRNLSQRHDLALVRRLLKSHAPDLSELTVTIAPIKTGSRRPSVRSTHCWKCQTGISNVYNVECEECRGIICTCGACLCGYGRWR